MTTWVYIAWALLPVLFAIAFSFNDGRSRSVWQGFSTRWWWGDPTFSVFHDPTYTHALVHSLELAALDMADRDAARLPARDRALALARARLRVGELPDAGPADDAGAGDGGLAAARLHPALADAVQRGHLGTTAQVIGQVTFSLSYVVVIVRSRLASIGPQYEEAARDLGASPRQALQPCLLPLLLPAIFASMLIVFALSIDDFVVTQYMSSSGETRRRSRCSSTRTRAAAPTTPALNAVATIMVVITPDRGRRRLPGSALVRPPHREPARCGVGGCGTSEPIESR